MSTNRRFAALRLLRSFLSIAVGTIAGFPCESLGVEQSRGGNAVRGKQTQFQSESIRADLCLGVAIAGINILIGIGLIIVFM
jgi:hypothetical protein